MNTNTQTVNLGDVCEVIAGQSPKGKYYNNEGEGLPFYQGKKEFGTKYIGPPSKWTTMTTKEALPGDVLISVRAPVGPINFSTQQICIGRGLAAIRAGSQINGNFLFYTLLAKQPEITGNEGAVFPSINKKQIQSLNIWVPPISEQKRIVAILDDAFAAIDKVVANTEKNLANARELFNSYLNALLSGNENNWVNIELSELTEHITDGDHSPPPKSATGIPFITISNIDKTNNTIDFSDTFFVPKSYYQTLKGKRRPQYGDVLYTVTGSFGIPVIIDFKKEFCFQRHIGLIRPTNEIDSKCLYYILLSRMVREQATERATGTAQKTISLKVLRSIVIPKIPIDEQLDFVSRLDSLSGQTQKLESIYQQKLSALAELKQSILQKAFSGELTADAANLENVA